MEEIDHVPLERRPYMMEIAERFLHLATVPERTDNGAGAVELMAGTV